MTCACGNPTCQRQSIAQIEGMVDIIEFVIQLWLKPLFTIQAKLGSLHMHPVSRTYSRAQPIPSPPLPHLARQMPSQSTVDVPSLIPSHTPDAAQRLLSTPAIPVPPPIQSTDPHTLQELHVQMYCIEGEPGCCSATLLVEVR